MADGRDKREKVLAFSDSPMLRGKDSLAEPEIGEKRKQRRG